MPGTITSLQKDHLALFNQPSKSCRYVWVFVISATVWISRDFQATLEIAKLGLLWSSMFPKVQILTFTLKLAPVSKLLACALLSPWKLRDVVHVGMKGQFCVLLLPNGEELQYCFHHKNITATIQCLRTSILVCCSFLEVVFAFSSRSIWMDYIPGEAWWASIVGWGTSSCNQCSCQHRLRQADWCFPHRMWIT